MSGNIQTRIPGIGGMGLDIYTVTAPGAGPPPVTASFILMEDGSSKILLEDGTSKILME